MQRGLDVAVELEVFPGRSREDQIGSSAARLLQDGVATFFDEVRRRRVNAIRADGSKGRIPFIGAGQCDRQARVAAEVDQYSREAVAHDQHGAIHQRRGRHPFQAAIDHVDLVGHFRFEVGRFACCASQLAADTLTDHAANGFAQVRGALVLDIGWLELVGLLAALLDQFALHQRRDKRRHAAQADIDVDRHELAVGHHDVREKAIQQKFLRALQVGHHADQDVGVEQKGHNLLQKFGRKKSPHQRALGGISDQVGSAADTEPLT